MIKLTKISYRHLVGIGQRNIRTDLGKELGLGVLHGFQLLCPRLFLGHILQLLHIAQGLNFLTHGVNGGLVRIVLNIDHDHILLLNAGEQRVHIQKNHRCRADEHQAAHQYANGRNGHHPIGPGVAKALFN